MSSVSNDAVIAEEAGGLLSSVRQLMQVTAAAEPARWRGVDVLGWNVPGSRRRGQPRGRYAMGLHAHETIEVCAAVDGRGVLDIGESRHTLEAPALVVIGPGVQHCEGYARRDAGYAAVWLSLAADGHLNALSAPYRGRDGWSTSWSARLPRDERGRLASWFDGPVGQLADAFELFRAELLTSLARLSRDLAAGDASRRPADRTGAAHRRVLEWVRHFVETHYAEPLSLAEIADMTRYTPNYLDALFSKWMGVGIHGYLTRQRMLRARRLCRGTSLPIRVVAQRVGYADPLYFSRAFRRHFGMSPSEAREAGRDGD